MKIHHTAVLLLLLIALSGAKDLSCNYECHSGILGGYCILRVATFSEYDQYPVPTILPRCKPCNAVCQERDNGFIGGITWYLFSVDDRIDYT